MRALFMLVLLLATPWRMAAQHGKVEKGYQVFERMLNDSVVQVERREKRGNTLRALHTYVGDRPVGIWDDFDRKGRLIAQRDFDQVTYAPIRSDEWMERFPATPASDSNSTDNDSTASDTTKFTLIEQMPMFPGGEAELFKFLGHNVRYPEEAIEAGITGNVIIKGMVDETGKWSNIEIYRSAHPYLDYEAWRVCNTMPLWSPGIQKGKPVKVVYTLPIRFSLH